LSYQQKTILLIITATMLRCILASITGLGSDEVYYVSYAQHLQWNYFDHPPMVALWIKLSAINLYGQQYELLVRMGAVLSAAGCTWLLYKTASMMHSSKAGGILYSRAAMPGALCHPIITLMWSSNIHLILCVYKKLLQYQLTAIIKLPGILSFTGSMAGNKNTAEFSAALVWFKV
jgi:hypothetical protein